MIFIFQVEDVRSTLDNRKAEYTSKRIDRYSSNNGDGTVLNDSEMSVLEFLKKELNDERDAQLKTEIRRIQTESALYDKELQSRVAAEKRQIEDATNVEAEQLRRKQVRLILSVF